MAETPGILVDSPAARLPGVATYKLLYTASGAGAVLSVHAVNRNAADTTIRIAVIEAATAYVDGGAPPAYSFVTYDRSLEGAGGEYDTPTYNLQADDKIVVWSANGDVAFLSQGFLF